MDAKTKILLSSLFAGLTAGSISCGGDQGCTSDLDCFGERICTVSGVCATPGARRNPTDPTDPTNPNDPTNPPPAERSVSELAVGGWSGGATCDFGGEVGSISLSYFWFLCPNGRVKGGEIWGTNQARFEFLDEGSYSVSGSTVRLSLSQTVVEPSEIRGDRQSSSYSLAYDSSADELSISDGDGAPICSGIPIRRVEGGGPEQVVNADCE